PSASSSRFPYTTLFRSIDGALEMYARAPDLILVGEEVKTREGFDLIGLFLRELIPRGTPAREVAERIRDQGGVVYLPHPFDVGRDRKSTRLNSSHVKIS